jgi:O-antigen ligase
MLPHTLPALARAGETPVAPPLGLALAIAALVLPTVAAFSRPPSPTFLNQALAIVAWCALLAWISKTNPFPDLRRHSPLAMLLAGVGMVLLATLGSWGWASLPPPLVLSAIAMLSTAGLALLVGGAMSQRDMVAPVFHALCGALMLAGMLNTAVGVVQVFFPELADGRWIAAGVSEGRASGNLRQPNHLSSLLLWSIIAAIWLMEIGRLRRTTGSVVVLAMLFALVLAASRTGLVGVALLSIWGGADKRMSRHRRALLLLAPVIYLAFFAGLLCWAQSTGQVFGGESRLGESSESPNSRLHIWANTLSLIAAHPWVGVGFGEFNFAWSLTPFPGRPTAFFDHTHNLPLQLAVELGVPLASLVLALLGYALWRAMRNAFGAPDGQRPMTSAAAMMVLMIAMHSLVEYPLWYSYFLLPTAFAWGLCLGAGAKQAAARAIGPSSHNARGSRALLLAAVLMAVGGMLSIADYLRVSAIFTAEAEAPPLSDRIEAGKRSVLFAHHAHYAAATTAESPSEALPSFNIAAHYLLDTRLMMAWAVALHESGDENRARYVAARLREFRNPDSAAFFAACEDSGRPVGETPFQCLPPTKSLSFEDFR